MDKIWKETTVDNLSASTDDKKSFFASLYAIDKVEKEDTYSDNDAAKFILDARKKSKEDEKRPKLLSSRSLRSRKSPDIEVRRSRANAAGVVNPASEHQRENSDPKSSPPPLSPSSRTQRQKQESVAKSSPPPPVSRPQRQRQTSTLSSSSLRAPTMLKASSKPSADVSLPKRKRGKDAGPKMAPEHKQMFKGMTFCFVPRELASGPRKRRIAKVIEYGAILSDDCKDDTDYLIVEKHFSLVDALRYLKIDKIPTSVIIVNEDYPSDCLHFGRMVEPGQSLYDIKGGRAPRVPVVPKAKPPKTPVEDEPSSNASLQLKPDKRNIVTETPPRSNATSNSKQTASRVSRTTLPPEIGPDVLVITTADADILDQMIAEAKEFADLPSLDDDEEGEVVMETNSEGSEDEDSSSRVRKRRRGSKSEKAGGQTFQCMDKHDGVNSGGNPNARTIEVLSELQKYYERINDTWRSLSYRKAISVLRKQNKRIVTAEDASKLPCIGERLAQKIEEIVWTNHLQRLEYAKGDPTDELLKTFLGVYGCGNVQAQKWISAGYQSLEDLLQRAKLSENQRIGVEHHTDFNSRIPREEVQQHGELVKTVALRIDPDLNIEIMGSYRRGAKDCGDIDMIITKPNGTNAYLKTVLDKLVQQLFKLDFLKCQLAASYNSSGSKWHGASCLGSGQPWRRIDFLIVPWAERGAALIYFTGNDIFNRSLRLLASKKGYRLNQHGLYKDVMRGPNRVKVTEGTLVEAESEEKIFEILGVPYRPPEHRIC